VRTHAHAYTRTHTHTHTHKQMHYAMTGIQTRGLRVLAAEVSLPHIHNILFRNVILFLHQIYGVV